MLNRILITLAILLILGSLPGFKPLNAQDSKGKMSYEEMVNTFRTTQVPTTDFSDDDLASVLTWLSSLTSIDFIARESLQDEQPTVTIAIKNEMTLFTFLNLLSTIEKLEFHFKDGVVMVVKEGEAFEEPVLRVYNVAPLQFKTSDFKGPELKLSSGAEGGFGAAEIDLGGIEEEPLTADDISDMIQTFAGGSTWDEVEGAGVEVQGGMLLVKQTPKVHEEITQLLQMLLDSN